MDHIYRSIDPDFIPSSSDLVRSTTETNWTDPQYDGGNVYYKVSAVDGAGNESEPAAAEMITEVPDPAMPRGCPTAPSRRDQVRISKTNPGAHCRGERSPHQANHAGAAHVATPQPATGPGSCIRGP